MFLLKSNKMISDCATHQPRCTTLHEQPLMQQNPLATISAMQTLDLIKNTISNLCDLISIAKGTRVQWIYYDLLENDSLISKVHIFRATRRYNDSPIISMMGSAGKEFKTFLETTYPIYAERCDPYRLHEGTIDAYLDAKGGSDLAEMRGQNLLYQWNG